MESNNVLSEFTKQMVNQINMQIDVLQDNYYSASDSSDRSNISQVIEEYVKVREQLNEIAKRFGGE